MAATFLVIDGTDGAGKQTQTERLLAAARRRGLRAATIDFPGYARTTSGRVVRQYLDGAFGDAAVVHPMLASYPYAVDRFESAPALRQLLAENDLVVADRYVVSNIAYQAAKLPAAERPAFRDWCASLDYDVLGNPRENAVIFLSLPIEISQRLIAQRNRSQGVTVAADLHESNQRYLATVLEEYKVLCGQRDGWYEIDCSDAHNGIRPIDDIAAEIEDLVFSRILAQSTQVTEVAA